MPQQVSEHLGIPPDTFEKLGVFDAVIGFDTLLFLDPNLLKKTRIPEFKGASQKIKDHFQPIITLLLASKVDGDRPWDEAKKRLIFRELHGVSIGYGTETGDGNAVGPRLALQLIKSAKEILNFGIRDPEIFELLGLFEEGFGADRLSDMTISIIKDNLFAYTERISQTLKLTQLVDVELNGRIYHLPPNPQDTKKPLLFLPRSLLRDLPVALSRYDIGYVVRTNTELRDRLNQLIGAVFNKQVKKKELRDVILARKEHIESIVEAYKSIDGDPYDFERDESGQVTWLRNAHKIAGSNPLSLEIPQNPGQPDIQGVVERIIFQFKKLVETNGVNAVLYDDAYEPRHEKYSQLLFYAIADKYCQDNNLDMTREANGGRGPVDFKFSRGYTGRALVEIKLSSNTHLVHGFESQLPTYEVSESASSSYYVILRTTTNDTQIKKVRALREQAVRAGEGVPQLIVIDARLQPSASRRHAS